MDRLPPTGRCVLTLGERSERSICGSSETFRDTLRMKWAAGLTLSLLFLLAVFSPPDFSQAYSSKVTFVPILSHTPGKI